MSIPGLKPETTYPAIVGRLLVAAREALGLDQAQVAREVGVTQPTWSRIERGDSALTVAQLAKAATALKTSPGEIMENADAAAEGLRAEGVTVHDERPAKAIKAGMALIGLAALAFLIARVLKK